MNRFLKIFGVILVCVIIVIIIQKIFFKTPATDRELLKFAREMNKTCPSMVDPETRLDKVIIFAGTNLQFNYTLVHKLKDSIPVARLKSYMEPVILNKIRNSGTLRRFLNKDLTWIYSYNDMKGEFLFKVDYKPERFK